MINPSQLRIGNLFYPINRNGKVHLPDEVPFIITEVALNEVKSYLLGKPLYQVVKYDTFSIRDILPIPLTEEWLLRFGFYEVEESEVYDKDIDGERYISINIKPKKCFVGASVDWTSIKFPESVHQLQNLYFALTGEELTIKL